MQGVPRPHFASVPGDSVKQTGWLGSASVGAVPGGHCHFHGGPAAAPKPPARSGMKRPRAWRNSALLTWLMSLVHAAFSCLDEATRMTVKGGASFGSTPILKSRRSVSWPGPLASSYKTRS